MKGVSDSRVVWGVAVLIALAAAVPSHAQAKCGVCGAPLTEKAVTVTDWETNNQHRYHDISCAAREMAARFPWSRAVAQSAASGERITLTRVNSTWRAEPESAVFVRPTPGEECENALVFADSNEFRAYREKHRGQIQEGGEPALLAQLPARLMGMATARKAGFTEGASGESKPAHQGATGAATFTDVPMDHWAAKFVEKAKALGLMQGYPDGTFRGDKPLTRYEMAAIISALADRGFMLAEPADAGDRSVSSAPEPAQEREVGVAAYGPGHPGEKAGARPAQRASFLGLSGPLSTPDARIPEAGRASFLAGGLNRRTVVAGAMGIGGGIEMGAASARLAGEDRVFVSGKARLDRLSRPGLDVAAGFTGFGTDTSVFGVATTEVQLAGKAVQISAGLGSGGILDGFFAGAAIPVRERLLLSAETANLGDGRHFNYGLDLRLRRNLGVRVGRVDGHSAGGVTIAREF